MNRLYATIGLLVIIGLAWWQYSSAITDIAFYKAENRKHLAELQVQKDLVLAKEFLLLEADKRASVYLADKKVIEDEAKSNSNCIADGTCGVVVHYKQAICADVSNTSSTKSRTDDSTGANSEDFARWYVTLEEALKKNELKIIKLQEDIVARSNKDYCLGIQTDKVE
jgi:hypothetical protein